MTLSERFVLCQIMGSAEISRPTRLSALLFPMEFLSLFDSLSLRVLYRGSSISARLALQITTNVERQTFQRTTKFEFKKTTELWQMCDTRCTEETSVNMNQFIIFHGNFVYSPCIFKYEMYCIFKYKSLNIFKYFKYPSDL